MTQTALADESGIPRNTLNRKINVGIFNFDELRRIARAVRRPLSSIIASAERLDAAEDAIGIPPTPTPAGPDPAHEGSR